jgi:hypothetical protein
VLADSILVFKEVAALKRFSASVWPDIEAKTPPSRFPHLLRVLLERDRR